MQVSSSFSVSNNSAIPGLLFYDALVNNSLSELKKCVELYKIDLNARLTHVRKRNHSGLCPIHLVVSKGYLEMLQYILQQGVNVQQATTILKRRAVHYAALRHQVSCLQILLNSGAKLDARDTVGNTPLHYAAEDGDLGLLCLLLNNGAMVDAQDITNKTALMKATRNGKVWAVRKLIAWSANVNVKDRHEETALHYACRQGSTEIINMLIKAGARLNAQNNNGLTPLMEAVSYNQSHAVSLLVRKRDIDLYKRDYSYGDTALHIAVKKNYVHIAEILLNSGNWYIEYNFNNLGESFVYDVIVYNRLDLLRLLLSYNYNFEQPAKRWPIVTSPVKSSFASLMSSSTSLLSSLTLQQTGGEDPVEVLSPEIMHHQQQAPCVKSPFQLALDKGHLEMAKILSDACCFTLRSPGLSIPQTVLAMPKRFSCLDEVKSLKQICRKVIRQCLGFELTDALPKLPLPAPLKDFLLLGDINWVNSTFHDQTVLVRSSARQSRQ